MYPPVLSFLTSNNNPKIKSKLWKRTLMIYDYQDFYLQTKNSKKLFS